MDFSNALCAVARTISGFVTNLASPSITPKNTSLIGYTDRPLTLTTVPTDVLDLILAEMYPSEPQDRSGRPLHYYEERCKGLHLLALSTTCRYLRQRTLPLIFFEVYNWPIGDGEQRTGQIWPESLWSYFVEVHLRDKTAAASYPRKPIALSPPLFDALPMMPFLKKVTLRFTYQIPAALLRALSLVPDLRTLEISDARLDGPPIPTALAFASLESLTLCIHGFEGMVPRPIDIDREVEVANTIALLRAVGGTLQNLQVSGDLLHPDSFASLSWPRLRRLILTEHPPMTYSYLQPMLGDMPVLSELSVLFVADMSRDQRSLRCPFTYGVAGDRKLGSGSPLLASVSLSNLEPTDPILNQLPVDLVTLQVLALYGLQKSNQGLPRNRHEAPLTFDGALRVLTTISPLADLVELTFTLDHFPTPDLVAAVADECPRLRLLELGHALYPRKDIYLLNPLTRLLYRRCRV
ncbi:hypothetical protein B0H10DRAFT_2443692 [Mycena sp. CBHHK59/15]|nr:hypothetical protein B0H10DRAFT_2443692 [Mycena sp. CBHHK59/15]